MGKKTKKERREEAEERKKYSASLSVSEKIKRAKSRPGSSKRELARLELQK